MTNETDDFETDDFGTYVNRYFDDLEVHIEILEDEASVSPDSEHRDALGERIAYLAKCKVAGDVWVDNDFAASPDAWKTLTTYTDVEAREQYKIWDEE